VPLVSRGSLPLKGKAEPLEVFAPGAEAGVPDGMTAAGETLS
jgi:hypothetical protein